LTLITSCLAPEIVNPAESTPRPMTFGVQRSRAEAFANVWN
jgi:hypothetical protein